MVFVYFLLFLSSNIQQFQIINWWKTVLSSGKYVKFRSISVETIEKEQEKTKQKNKQKNPTYMLTICT